MNSDDAIKAYKAVTMWGWEYPSSPQLHLKDGGSPSDLGNKVASADMLAAFTRDSDYNRWQHDYLGQSFAADR